MKIITLNDSSFQDKCRILAKSIKGSFSPDIIISIKTGGKYVGDIVFQELSQDNNNIKYTWAETHRPGHNVKNNSLIQFFFQQTPIFILNWLRIIESYILRLLPKQSTKEIFLCASKEIEQLLLEADKKILVVDDAIDSGITMNLVCEYISNRFPGNTIKTAAITTTTPNPLINADFCIYHLVLIRFPWSKDYKK